MTRDAVVNVDHGKVVPLITTFPHAVAGLNSIRLPIYHQIRIVGNSRTDQKLFIKKWLRLVSRHATRPFD